MTTGMIKVGSELPKIEMPKMASTMTGTMTMGSKTETKTTT